MVTGAGSRPRSRDAPDAVRADISTEPARPAPAAGPVAVLTAEAAQGPEDEAALLRGSAWLVATVAVNAASGFAFWLVAARLEVASDVGRGAALLTSVLAINYVTSLGLPVAAARYAAGYDRAAGSLLRWALVASSLGSVIGSAAFLALAPASVLSPIRAHGLVGAGLFTATAVGTAIGALADVRLMSLRRWSWVLSRALVVGVLRLPLLWWPGADGAWGLFVVSAGLPALSGLVAGAAVVSIGAGRGRLLPAPATFRRAARYSGVNYLSMLASEAPQYVLPLIVLVSVSPVDNASFYLAWSMTTLVFLVPQTIGQVLLVEGGREGGRLGRQMRLALGMSLGVTAALTLAAIALAPPLVELAYGSDYRLAGRLLPVLVAACMGWAITSVCLTAARIREHSWPAVVMTGALAVTVLVPATLLTADHGVAGAAGSWLGGNVLAALVAGALVARNRARPGPGGPGRG